MILCFSGTGNSRYVAEKLAAGLGEDQKDLKDLNSLIRAQDHTGLRSEKPWVVVTPTYAWQLPHLVRDFLLKTELSGSREIYFVLTCGDSIGNAGGAAQELCRQKGMNYRGLAGVIMPENYIAMFRVPGQEEARRIAAAAEGSIEAVRKQILSGERLPEHITPADRIMTAVFNPFFYAVLVKDRKFAAGDACTGCGHCAAVCPLGNIVLKEGRPRWQGNCTHCMACICRCPAKAIEYGKASVGKPRYLCPKTETE